MQERSPRVSGRYIRGHRLFIDGGEFIGKDIPVGAEEYTFINTVPYARKIEIGKTKSGRAFVLQVPNRIYERTAKDARRRVGNSVDVKFTYTSLSGAASRGNRFPAIIVRPRSR